MSYTCQSEIGKIHSLFIKKAADAMVDEASILEQWRALNFIDLPDLPGAVTEYAAFESLLARAGAAIEYFPPDVHVNMDSIYCRDAAIATDHGMILCNMGKSARANEPDAQRKAYKAKGVAILGTIRYPGTVEGGDVAWLDERTLAVGSSYRTNEEGIRQLRALLAPFDVTVVPVALPHYKGPSDVFHLMSIFSPVDKDMAVIYSPLMPINFRNLLLDGGYTFIEVPDAEFESMGCNVLALAPRECLMVAGNPLTRAALEAAGCVVSVYEGSEISVKGGGGPTCLTRPLLRLR